MPKPVLPSAPSSRRLAARTAALTVFAAASLASPAASALNIVPTNDAQALVAAEALRVPVGIDGAERGAAGSRRAG